MSSDEDEDEVQEDWRIAKLFAVADKASPEVCTLLTLLSRGGARLQ